MTESIIEQAALAWFEHLGWTVKHGPKFAPGELAVGVQVCPATRSAEETWRQ